MDTRLERVYDDSTTTVCAKAPHSLRPVVVPDFLAIDVFGTGIFHTVDTGPIPCAAHFRSLSPLPHPVNFKIR